MSDFSKYVPEDLQLFYEIVGKEAYEEVVRVYGGSNVYIPMMETYNREERNQKIYEEFCSGASFKELGLKWGLAANTVRGIVYKCRRGK